MQNVVEILGLIALDLSDGGAAPGQDEYTVSPSVAAAALFFAKLHERPPATIAYAHIPLSKDETAVVRLAQSLRSVQGVYVASAAAIHEITSRLAICFPDSGWEQWGNASRKRD